MRKLLATLALAAAVLVVPAIHVHAQEAAAAAAPKGKTFGEMWHNGGWVMYPLLISSILMVGFTGNGFYQLRVARLAPPALVAKVREQMSMGSYQEAWQTCEANECYFSTVLSAGLERIGRGKEIVDHIMQDVAVKEASLMKTQNTYLSVIGVVTPMIGLTGTVVGMIKAFSVLGQAGITDPAALSEKISEVLIATASGLIVAIPAFVFYYVLRNRAQTVVILVDSILNRLMEDIPYADLSGIKIGENFSAGAAVYADPGYAPDAHV